MCSCNSSENLGAQLGSKIGTEIGDYAYKKGKQIWGEITGRGAYKISSNSLIEGPGGIVTTTGMAGSSTRLHRVKRTEFLHDIRTNPSVSGAFNLYSVHVNPGILTSFPWGSTIMQQYDQWQPYGIVYEFRSTASDYSATTNLGTVTMATEYNMNEPNPPNKVAMRQMAFSNSAVITANQLHGIECDPQLTKNPWKYVRSGGINSLVTNISPNDYDHCKFFLATEGGTLPANTIIGELWVHYDIMVQTEDPTNGIQARGLLNAYFSSTTSTNATLFQGMTQIYGNWNPGCSGNVITLPRHLAGATFGIFVFNSAAATVVFADKAATGDGLTVDASFTAHTGDSIAWIGCYYQVTITGTSTFGGDATLTFAGGLWPATNCAVIISQVSSGCRSLYV